MGYPILGQGASELRPGCGRHPPSAPLRDAKGEKRFTRFVSLCIEAIVSLQIHHPQRASRVSAVVCRAAGAMSSARKVGGPLCVHSKFDPDSSFS